MQVEEMVSLDCPCCKEGIERPLSWFKQTYATCPLCGAGVAAGQFAGLVQDLEQALEEAVAEMVLGKPGHGCCGGHHG